VGRKVRGGNPVVQADVFCELLAGLPELLAQRAGGTSDEDAIEMAHVV
jgi:hypothetical protein